jgi:hypothetical protein
MTPKTLKPSVVWTIFCLLVLFFLLETTAFSATTTLSSPNQVLSNTVTATNSNGAPSACPLPTGTAPKGDIRDIRGPIHIPDPGLWILYALGGVLLLFLAWAVWKWFSKQKSLRHKEAFEIAFEELEKAKALMKPEMAESFSVMVSKTIRTYVEKRFGMKVTRKTTHEFIALVAAEPSSELNRHSEALQEFLGHLDLAKFARRTFSGEQMEKMHRSAWRFVEETRPQPKENEKDASPVSADAMSTQTIGNNISGKKSLFKGGLKGRFPWTIRKGTGERGFNSSHQVVTAGGR